MRGHSHILIGLSGGILINSLLHVTRSPSLQTASFSGFLVVPSTYYLTLVLGSLLPDSDHPSSTLGRHVRWLNAVGVRHRTMTHSLFGLLLNLVLVSLLLLGGMKLMSGNERSIVLSFPLIVVSQMGLGIGYGLHLFADSLTKDGIALLWPSSVRYNLPCSRRKRFRTGTWPEYAIDALVLLLITLGVSSGWLILL